MKTVTLEIPDDLAQKLGGQSEVMAREIRLSLALHWCSRGEIAIGKAVRLAGVSYATFLEEAARRKVEIIHYNQEDIEEEVQRPLPGEVNLEAIKQDVCRAQSSRG